MYPYQPTNSVLTTTKNDGKLSYCYYEDGKEQHVDFNLSDLGMIDSTRYTLLDVLHDKRLDNLSFSDRMDIMSSFARNMKAVHHYTYRRELMNICDAEVNIKCSMQNEVKKMINLASNDYLNLSIHPRVRKVAADCAMESGFGSGSTPMFAGTHTIHRDLEKRIAAFKHCEDAMLFTSGYGANVGILKALLKENDVAICDMYAHASLMDGCTDTNQLFFAHNDMRSLESALKKADGYRNKIVIIDGVYSMEGDIAKLDKILALAHAHGAWVLCDEAHATGVIGDCGKGTAALFGLEGKVDIITGTFSKALGGVGGFVAGSHELINYLQIAARSYMFSTSPPLPVAAALLEALHVIETEPQHQQHLWENTRYFRNNLQHMGFNTGASETCIIPIIIGNDAMVKEMAYRLHEAGVLVNAVPYPAVPRKLTRIRITVSANLNKAQMDYALEQIERIGRELEIIDRQNYAAA